MTTETARDILTTHARSKRNGALPASATHRASLVNPRCGDEIELHFLIENDRIVESGFRAKACAICTAASSLLCETVRALPITEALHRADLFESSLNSAHDLAWPTALAQIEALSHIRQNPARLACALLPWITLRKALAN